MSPFEAGMLACFFSSWPFAVWKTWRTKTAAGKSFTLLWLLFIGYLLGILHKVIYNLDIIVLLYILNGAFVLTELVLCSVYRRRARAEGARGEQGGRP